MSWRLEIPILAMLDAGALKQLGLELSADQKAAEEGGARLRANFLDCVPMGQLLVESLFEASRERAENKWMFASGPTFRRGTPGECRGAWYFDPAHPETLWFACVEAASPVLWIEVPAELDAIAAAVASVQPEAGEFPRRLRAWMGWIHELGVPNVYSGELVGAEPDQLTNYWVFNPYRGGANMAAFTACTGSQATIELHHDSAYVWDMAYRPAPHAATVRYVNGLIGVELFPEDLPVDLVGCALGFHFITRRNLERQLEQCTEEDRAARLPNIVTMLAGLGYGEDDYEHLLEGFSADEDIRVRREVAAACHRYGLPDLMQRMADAEVDEAFREDLAFGVHPEAPLLRANPIG